MGTDLETVRSSRCSILSTLPACPWCLHCHNLQSIQHLLLPRDIILILGRQTWVVTVLTRTPTATWSRKWCLRTNANLTQRRHAILRIRSLVLPSPSETAPVLSKLTWRESVST